MQGSIKAILTKHGVQNPQLLTELNELWIMSMRGAKQYGKKSIQLPSAEEDTQYDRFITLVREVCDSNGSIFALRNIDDFCAQYGLYRKPVETIKCPFVV